MDAVTLDWYARQAPSLAGRYESAASPVAPLLADIFAAGSTLLDVGCGSGRDLALMLAAGYDAWGLEPSEAMRKEALHYHPELDGRLFEGGLPETGLPATRLFDGVLCVASFMHVPVAQRPAAASALARLLKPHGRLLLSVPAQRPGLDGEDREPGGRLFAPLDSQAMQGLFGEFGFVVTRQFEQPDGLLRQEVSWLTVLLQKASTQA